MTLPDNVLTVIAYAVIGLLAILLVGFTVAPKRMRRTVNYLLTTYQEWKQVKADPNAQIEVPDFETKKFPKVEPMKRKDKP